MLKYLNYQILPNEIPNELSLGISVLGCPQHCEGCHSPHLWDVNSAGLGKDLDIAEWHALRSLQNGFSCVLFMGGDWNPSDLMKSILEASTVTERPCALYSGQEFEVLQRTIDLRMLKYLKWGAYRKDLGGLQSRTSNQQIWRLEDGVPVENLNHYFWRH